MATRLGEKIRQLRKEQQMTLDALALAAGMSKSYLWELENKESPRPSAEKLDALAKILGRPVSYFLDSEEEVPEEEHLNEAFFRNYKDLEKEDRERIRMIVESFRKRS
ncbi:MULTISPECIES: helix-turn-helix transcriptional regulator [Lysobacteraceae]|uniref:helix-turn-helix domain-containing protein n=1 Tax=Lysobacteraceae TaxID=32033 RepID=UPI000785C127|nr:MULTISPECIES: helix-turn-helix transcriptional regulator [Xanthomonadaceae]MBN8224016.1 helix-turn-helix transcriptional regulator [Xanthomonadales bacterium]MDH1274102.1 helix-turn-helix domain-containing protein [Stenotrophomonas sp. GD03937]